MRKIFLFLTSAVCIIIFVPVFGFGWISTIVGQILNFFALVLNFLGGALGLLWEKIIFALASGWHFVTTGVNWALNYFVLRYVEAGFFPPIFSTVALAVLQWFAFTKKLLNRGRALLRYAFRWTKLKLSRAALKFLRFGKKLQIRAKLLKQTALEKFKSLL